jgi:hypothetical protein
MNLVELLKLRPARALVAAAMVAGAAFAAVPAEAATTPGSLSISVDTTSPATFNKPVGYVVKVVNTTGQDLSNVIVGDGFVSGAKLSSGVTGLPSNSCVKGRLGFGCLVPTLPNNSEVDVFFTGTPSASTVNDLAAVQAFVNGVWTTRTVSLSTAVAGL